MRFLKGLMALIMMFPLLFWSGGIAQDATATITENALPEFTITATDTGFEVPVQIVEGRYQVTFKNAANSDQACSLETARWSHHRRAAIGPSDQEPGSTGVARLPHSTSRNSRALRDMPKP